MPAWWGRIMVVIVLVGCGCNTIDLLTGDSCARSEVCALDGACKEGEGDECVVVSTTDCRASESCREFGRCEFDADASPHCIATRVEHCVESQGCTDEGLCSLIQLGCAPSDSGCKRTSKCAESGRCHADLREIRVEGAVEITYDCVERASVADGNWCDIACAEEGLCWREGHRCVAAKDGECRRSDRCRTHGMCTRDAASGTCVAGTDEDCKGSTGCAQHGRCEVVVEGQVCYTPAPATP